MGSPAPPPATESSAQHQAAASNGADPTATAPTIAALKQVADYDQEIQALGSTEEAAKKIPATGDPALATTMATGIGGAIATLAGIVRNRRKREH